MSEKVPIAASRSVRAVKGGMLSVSGQLVARGADFITLLVLARTLQPSDFGLVAIAMAVIVVMETVLELPVTAVLINVKNPTSQLLATAFTLTALRAFAVGLIATAAGYILWLIHQDPRLLVLTPALALAPAMRGLASPRIALRAQQLDFKPQFIIDITSKIASCVVAVSYALYYHTYWAIVAGTLTTPAVILIISYWIEPYKPKLSLAAWKSFSSFVGWNGLSQTMTAISWQLDRFLLPSQIDSNKFGQYTAGSDLSALPHKIICVPLITPIFAGLSAAHHISEARLKSAHLKSLEALATLAFPIYSVLIFFSSPIIGALFGAKWEGVATVVSFICATGLTSIPRIILNPLCYAIDKPRYITIASIVELFVKISLLLYLTITYGLEGALGAQMASGIIICCLSLLLARHLIQASVLTQLGSLARPAVASSCTIVVGHLFYWSSSYIPFSENSHLMIVAAVTLMLSFYSALIIVLWRVSGRPEGLVGIAIVKLGSMLKLSPTAQN